MQQLQEATEVEGCELDVWPARALRCLCHPSASFVRMACWYCDHCVGCHVTCRLCVLIHTPMKYSTRVLVSSPSVRAFSWMAENVGGSPMLATTGGQAGIGRAYGFQGQADRQPVVRQLIPEKQNRQKSIKDWQLNALIKNSNDTNSRPEHHIQLSQRKQQKVLLNVYQHARVSAGRIL